MQYREMQYREMQQPPRPKSAPLGDQRIDDVGEPRYEQPNQRYATLGRARDVKDGQENR